MLILITQLGSREMVTDEIPYANMHINEIVLNVGWEKKQVEIPTKGHPVILQIIKMCLNFDVEKRPQFKEITEKLQESLKELSKKNKVKDPSRDISLILLYRINFSEAYLLISPKNKGTKSSVQYCIYIVKMSLSLFFYLFFYLFLKRRL